MCEREPLRASVGVLFFSYSHLPQEQGRYIVPFVSENMKESLSHGSGGGGGSLLSGGKKNSSIVGNARSGIGSRKPSRNSYIGWGICPFLDHINFKASFDI